MVSSRRSRLLAALAAIGVLSACADYGNHWDTVTFRAGNAMSHNSGVQEISPWPRHVEDTTIEHGG
ncbi:hypothetical protein [Actibacterium sp. MT2.3-13A]|uniref:hypothetical protein n=1 Tax=Actibacterium sp. MT2.3-13A TaxID=2828332 RepID=UPI001BAA1A4E|nr:hypothetical protein [Actibacterium sp. MT2.3-13A]